LSLHNAEGGKSDYRNEGQKFGSHKIRTAKWRNCCFTLNRCIHVGSSFFCPAKLIVGIAGSGGGEEPSGVRSPPPDSDPFSDAQFGKTCVGLSRQFAGAGIADSSSINAVSFSSARTTKRFPSSRCASARKL